MHQVTCNIMMVADVLVPNRHQAISNHNADPTVISVTWIMLQNIHILKQMMLLHQLFFIKLATSIKVVAMIKTNKFHLQVPGFQMIADTWQYDRVAG